MSIDAHARQEEPGGEVLLGSRRVRYQVVRSTRARLIRLRMRCDGSVEIVVPARAAIPSIEGLLRSEQRWICRQLDRFEQTAPAETDRVDYLGKECRVVVTRQEGRTGRITLEEGTIRAVLPSDVEVAPLIESFLRREAGFVLRGRTHFWADAMQVEYGRISVRDQRTRWGSCSTSGGLSFSWRLVMAPLPVLDYVVIHELMHRREMNHGKEFWDGVARFCPEHQQHRAWLKEHGVRLARPLKIEGSSDL